MEPTQILFILRGYVALKSFKEKIIVCYISNLWLTDLLALSLYEGQ